MDDYMQVLSKGKTLVLIDGSNLHGSTRTLGFEVDFKALMNYMQVNLDLANAYFFCVEKVEADNYSKLASFLNAITHHGYQVVRKRVYRSVSRDDSSPPVYIDTDLSVIAMASLLDIRDLRNVIIFSGNGDLETVITQLRNRGITVAVVSAANSIPNHQSQRARKAASLHVETETFLHNARAVKDGIKLDEMRGTRWQEA